MPCSDFGHKFVSAGAPRWVVHACALCLFSICASPSLQLDYLSSAMAYVEPKLDWQGAGGGQNNTYGPRDYYRLYSFYQLVDLCIYNEPHAGPKLELLAAFSTRDGHFRMHNRRFRNVRESLDGQKLKELLDSLGEKSDSIVKASQPKKRRQRVNQLGFGQIDGASGGAAAVAAAE